MASVLSDAYGAHRQLDVANGELEVILRWNGPEPSQADPLLRYVSSGSIFRSSAAGITKCGRLCPEW